MARKKQLKYNDIGRVIREMQEQQEKEKRRIESVMMGRLLTTEAATILGDYSDVDLMRIASIISSEMGTYAARLDAEKQSRRKEQQVQPKLGIVPEMPEQV